MSNGSDTIQVFEDIASLQPGGPTGAPGAGTTVERALREVLGWTPKAGDPKGFVAALTRSFAPVDVPGIPGMRTWNWTPRGYALQADLGALAGAQASIYRRGQQARDAVLPLIEGLEPLIEWADDEAMRASREIVSSLIGQIVDELGAEGGPSTALVDGLFDELVGTLFVTGNTAENVGGQLGGLRDRFGIKRALVNTVEEEQNFTNYLVLADYIIQLRVEWQGLREFFTGGPGSSPFFGTQLVLISRELAVTAESIREVYAALDAILVGSAERETLSVVFDDGSTIFLGALLGWADRFITTDAPRLVENAGREGALSLKPTLKMLSAQVAKFIPAPTGAPSGFPAIYNNTLVRSTLGALQGGLDRLVALVQQLEPSEPVLGFPLSGDALGPTIADVRQIIDVGNSRQIFEVTGLRLAGATLALLATERVELDMALQLDDRVVGSFDPNDVAVGTWPLVLRQAETDFVLGSIPIAAV